MTETRHVPTAEEAMQALRDHVVDRALHARRKHGPEIDGAAIRAMLLDSECVRFSTRIVFDGSDLLPGEFAHAHCRGPAASDGFDLFVHPHFIGREQDLPLLAAYHVVSINWLDVATHEEAELYAAALLGLEVDDYYQRLCALADEVGESTLTDLHVPGWDELDESGGGCGSHAHGDASGHGHGRCHGHGDSDSDSDAHGQQQHHDHGQPAATPGGGGCGSACACSGGAAPTEKRPRP